MKPPWTTAEPVDPEQKHQKGGAEHQAPLWPPRLPSSSPSARWCTAVAAQRHSTAAPGRRTRAALWENPKNRRVQW